MGKSEIKELREKIHEWAESLGFCQVGFSNTKLDDHGKKLQNWLKAGFNADMDYMANHGSMRWTPDRLKPGTKSIISLRIFLSTTFTLFKFNPNFFKEISRP